MGALFNQWAIDGRLSHWAIDGRLSQSMGGQSLRTWRPPLGTMVGTMLCRVRQVKIFFECLDHFGPWAHV